MGVKRIFSWNVNGLRACMGKGFMDFLAGSGADCLCLQETKMQPEQATWDWGEYTPHWFSAEKKGYSGTAIIEREAPLSVVAGFPADYADHPQEGRVLTAEYPEFYLVCAYVPNAQEGLARLPYRLHFEADLRRYLACGKVPYKPVKAGSAKRAIHTATDLRRYALSVSVRIFHQNALYYVTVRK